MPARIRERRSQAVAAWAAAVLLALAPAPDAGAQARAGGMGTVAAQAQAGADVVVLLDTSQSVLPWFQDAVEYVVGPVARDFLRLGDTFHLLSFGSATQVEIAQRVESERDVRSILGKLYLLYPVGRSTDLLGALAYLGQYLADLPAQAPKYVIVVTDGVNDPGDDSPSRGLSPGEAASAFMAEADRIRRNGWRVRIVKLPFSAERAAAEAVDAGRPAPSGTQAAGTGGTGTGALSAARGEPSAAGGTTAGGTSADGTDAADPGAALLERLGEALGTEVTPFTEDGKEDVARRGLSLPVAIFPEDLGKRGYDLDLPLRFSNPTAEEARLELEAVLVDGSDALRERRFVRIAPGGTESLNAPLSLSPGLEPGPRELSVELRFADGNRTSPDRATVRLILAPNPLAALLKSAGGLIVALVALVLVILGAVLALSLLRHAPRRSAAPVVRAVRGEAERRPQARPASAATPATAATAASPSTAAAKAGAAESPSAFAAEATRPLPRPAAGGVEPPAASPPAGPTAGVSLAGNRAGAAVPEAKPGSEAPSTPPAAAGIPIPAGRVPPPGRAPAARPAGAMEGQPAPARHVPAIVRPGKVTLELRVAEQNAHIGARNIHELQAGSSRTIGGGRSDFLIFLVPMPAHCAELHFDGERLVLAPLRPELFPGNAGPVEVRPGRPIEMRSPKGWPLSIEFHPYEPPADRINRLLHCIETPGLFSFDLE